MNSLQRRSAASRKAHLSKKRQTAAVGAATKAGPKPLPAYLQRIVDATTANVLSADIAAKLGLHAAYVRTCWRRAGLGKRKPGPRPTVTRERVPA